MPTDLSHAPDPTASAAGPTGGAERASGATPAGADQTGARSERADQDIRAMRERIDEIDHALISLWQERAALSQQVGATRVASGGTRLVLARERQILDRFRDDLGADGTQLGLLLLRAGRGPL